MDNPTPAPAPAPVAEMLPVRLKRAYYYTELGGWRGPEIDDDERWQSVAQAANAAIHAALADLLPGSTPESIVQDVRRALLSSRAAQDDAYVCGRNEERAWLRALLDIKRADGSWLLPDWARAALGEKT